MSFHSDSKRKNYSYDKTKNHSQNRPLSNLQRKYYEEKMFEDTAAIKGMWLETEYLDRQGTQEYYVYSYGKNIYDWYLNWYVRTCMVKHQ